MPSNKNNYSNDLLEIIFEIEQKDSGAFIINRSALPSSIKPMLARACRVGFEVIHEIKEKQYKSKNYSEQEVKNLMSYLYTWNFAEDILQKEDSKKSKKLILEVEKNIKQVIDEMHGDYLKHKEKRHNPLLYIDKEIMIVENIYHALEALINKKEKTQWIKENSNQNISNLKDNILLINNKKSKENLNIS